MPERNLSLHFGFEAIPIAMSISPSLVIPIASKWRVVKVEEEERRVERASGNFKSSSIRFPLKIRDDKVLLGDVSRALMRRVRTLGGMSLNPKLRD